MTAPCLHRRSRQALLSLAVLLAACGPGVGGSGSGNEAEALLAFGASAQPLCSSELAGVLGCTLTTLPGGGPTPAPSLAGPVVLADRADGRQVQAVVIEERVLLEAPCARLVFSGLWAKNANSSARFYGVLASGGGIGSFATLEARSDGGAVVLTLRDAAEVVLLGPLRVAPVAATGSFGACS